MQVPLFVLMAHRYAVLSLSFAAHCADVLVSGSADHSIRLWDCRCVMCCVDVIVF